MQRLLMWRQACPTVWISPLTTDLSPLLAPHVPLSTTLQLLPQKSWVEALLTTWWRMMWCSTPWPLQSYSLPSWTRQHLHRLLPHPHLYQAQFHLHHLFLELHHLLLLYQAVHLPHLLYLEDHHHLLHLQAYRHHHLRPEWLLRKVHWEVLVQRKNAGFSEILIDIYW